MTNAALERMPMRRARSQLQVPLHFGLVLTPQSLRSLGSLGCFLPSYCCVSGWCPQGPSLTCLGAKCALRFDLVPPGKELI